MSWQYAKDRFSLDPGLRTCPSCDMDFDRSVRFTNGLCPECAREKELAEAAEEELGDLCHEPTDYSTIRAVCRECATAAGFVPKDKVVGVWIGECGICHERKPCTDLHHDWRRKKEGGAK